MKKILSILIVVVGLFTITGCNSGEKTMTCTRTVSVSDGVKMDLTYKATYKKDIVLNVETIEKVISDDEDLLETYKEKVEAAYEPYQDIDYYVTSVKINGDTLTSKTSIDYKKIDLDKLVEVDSANKSLLDSDGNVKLSVVKSIYESVGATCK